MNNKAAAKLALSRYIGQIRREWKYAIPGLVLPGIGSIFVAYLPPLVVAAMLNKFANTRPDLHAILPYLFWFGGLWFAGELIWRIAFYFLAQADGRGMRNLYVEGMEELARKDLTFFHDNFAGSLTKKTLAYGRSFENFMDTLSFNVIAQLIPIIFAMVILWRFSPLIDVVLVALIAVVSSVVIPLIRRRRKLVYVRERASNVMAGHVADFIGNIDAVQAFAHEDYEMKLHRSNAYDYIAKAVRTWDYQTFKIDMFISPMYVLINVLGLAVAIMFGKDGASMATIFITFNYYAYITRILWEFNRIYRNIENALTEAAQFTELLLVPNSLKDVANPKPLHVTRGEVQFDHVDFTHAGQKDALFSDLNLHIAAGEKLALVGHSGGGKSTITRLLLRFSDIDSGQLLIDGQNIAESRLRDLRRAIAYVPQEPVMFHRTIRENIRYGKLNATDEEVIAAAKKANAHDFITQLPEGYDTMVGERGVKLSGGQRQRVAIARAVIKDAPILVLDEATSALDSESEKLIQAALWDLMKSRTAIVIAHRLSTIQKMDRIIVLDQGRITEEGTHKELLEHSGTYATLWAHQSGGFLEEE